MIPTEFHQMLLSEAKAELVELRDKVRIQEKYIEALEQKISNSKEQAFEESLSNSGRIPRKGKDNDENLPVPTRIYLMLKEEKQPMRFSKIHERLGKNKVAISVVATALERRDDLFVKLKRGLYALKEWAENGEGQ